MRWPPWSFHMVLMQASIRCTIWTSKLHIIMGKVWEKPVNSSAKLKRLLSCLQVIPFLGVIIHLLIHSVYLFTVCMCVSVCSLCHCVCVSTYPLVHCVRVFVQAPWPPCRMQCSHGVLLLQQRGHSGCLRKEQVWNQKVGDCWLWSFLCESTGTKFDHLPL